MILREVKISHMKTGRKFSVILTVFPINPNTTFERKQRALDGTETSSNLEKKKEVGRVTLQIKRTRTRKINSNCMRR